MSYKRCKIFRKLTKKQAKGVLKIYGRLFGFLVSDSIVSDDIITYNNSWLYTGNVMMFNVASYKDLKRVIKDNKKGVKKNFGGRINVYQLLEV